MTLKRIPPGLVKQVYLVVLTYITYFMVGVCRSFIAFLILQLRTPESPIQITQDEESWLGSLTILPNPIGCFIGGVLMDAVGRRHSLLMIFVPFCAAWAVIAFANNISMLYIGILLNGIGSGMSFCTATYITEICTAEYRGALLSFLEPIFAFGVVFCNVVVYVMEWKTSAVVFLVMSVCGMISMILLPESPTWLIGKGRKQEAMNILRWLRDTEYEAQTEALSAEAYSKSWDNGNWSYSQVCREMLEAWKPSLILIIMFICQQLAGWSVFVSYTTIFFQALEFPIDSSIAAIVYSALSCLSGLLTPLATNRFPRRTCLAFSGFTMAMCLIVLAVYEQIYLYQTNKPFFEVMLLLVYLYNIFCALGVLVIPFIMSAELFPSRIRGVACGICGAIGYLTGGIILKVFPYYLNHLGIVPTLWTFAIFCLILVPYARYLLPETMGKTLNQIQEEYFAKRTRNYGTYA